MAKIFGAFKTAVRVGFDAGRVALLCGEQKRSLHQAGREFEPKVLRLTRGSANLCFSATDAIEAGVVTINRDAQAVATLLATISQSTLRPGAQRWLARPEFSVRRSALPACQSAIAPVDRRRLPVQRCP